MEGRLESGNAAKADAASEEVLTVWGARMQGNPFEAIDASGTPRTMTARGRVFQAERVCERRARLLELTMRLEVTAARAFGSLILRAIEREVRATVVRGMESSGERRGSRRMRLEMSYRS